jgi:hypothetical protein
MYQHQIGLVAIFNFAFATSTSQKRRASKQILCQTASSP